MKVTFRNFPCIAFGAIVLLAGCGSDGDQFTKPGATHEQFQADMSDCLAQAQAKNPNPDRGGLPILFRLRDKCMQDRGYTKQD